MGLPQHRQRSRTTARPLRPRSCLRKGCGSLYHPTQWNQRYCQQADCLRQVRRWQAAKRQRDHRRLPANRKRHAEAEAQRRRDRAERQARQDPVAVEATVHLDGAWSRSKTIPAEFCDRPGCYEPLSGDSRAPTRYCGADCRQAVRRVLDRERKWLTRNGYDAEHLTRPVSQAMSEQLAEGLTVAPQVIGNDGAKPVGGYRANPQQALSCRAIERHPLPDHKRGALRDGHCQTNSGCRSRPPPT
jgi:hypothetical protein